MESAETTNTEGWLNILATVCVLGWGGGERLVDTNNWVPGPNIL